MLIPFSFALCIEIYFLFKKRLTNHVHSISNMASIKFVLPWVSSYFETNKYSFDFSSYFCIHRNRGQALITFKSIYSCVP